jgi:hypothetical protein
MYRFPSLLTKPRWHRWLLWARKARGFCWLLVLILLALLTVSLLLGPTPPGLARGNSFETYSTVLPRDRPRFCTGTDPNSRPLTFLPGSRSPGRNVRGTLKGQGCFAPSACLSSPAQMTAGSVTLRWTATMPPTVGGLISRTVNSESPEKGLIPQ